MKKLLITGLITLNSVCISASEKPEESKRRAALTASQEREEIIKRVAESKVAHSPVQMALEEAMRIAEAKLNELYGEKIPLTRHPITGILIPAEIAPKVEVEYPYGSKGVVVEERPEFKRELEKFRQLVQKYEPKK